jgi:V8-like Glu-specific endopeptidase
MKWVLISFFFINSTLGQSVNWDEFSSTVGIEVFKTSSKSVCSGVLLTPNLVLTAAHCLEDIQSARVTIHSEISPASLWYKATNFISHPDYIGNLPGESIDIGLILLEGPIYTESLPRRANYRFNVVCERIGYGARKGKNLRTWQDSFPREITGTSLMVKDEYGQLGDSGGPVYQRQDDILKLIGVHTGRQLKDDGSVRDVSYVQLLTDEVWFWILKTIETRKLSSK